MDRSYSNPFGSSNTSGGMPEGSLGHAVRGGRFSMRWGRKLLLLVVGLVAVFMAGLMSARCMQKI